MLWSRPILSSTSTPIDAHFCSNAEMLYQQVLCTTVLQQIRHTDPHVNAECDHLNQCATQSAEYHDQQGCCKRPPFFAGQPYLSSMTPGTCGSLPTSSAKPKKAHTWSKSLVMDSTDMLMSTFVGTIIQMLSNQTHPTLAM